MSEPSSFDKRIACIKEQYREAIKNLVTKCHTKHWKPELPGGALVSLPHEAGAGAVACDGCEEVSNMDVTLGEDDGWLCEKCVQNGVSSKRWPLGLKRKNMGGKGGRTTKFRKHTQAEELSTAENLVDMGPADYGEMESLFQPSSDVFPVQYEDFFVLSLGQVDSRRAYHSNDQILPVGYKSCWHDKVTKSIFVSEVLVGDDGTPIFKVSRLSCSSFPSPSGSTLILDENYDLSISEEENISFQLLLSTFVGNDILPSSFENSPGITTIHSLNCNDEIGEFYSIDSSPSAAWKKVIMNLVKNYRIMASLDYEFSFFCDHVEDEMVGNSSPRIAKFSYTSCPFNIPSLNDIELTKELFAKLEIWLGHERFGLEVGFVQEMIEQLPGVELCSQYTELKRRSCYSSSLTVGNGFLLVKTKDGIPMKGPEALHSLFVMKKPKPPLNTNLPPQIVGNTIQVLEFFQRFIEELALNNDLFSMNRFERELCDRLVDDFSTNSALSIVHMSILKVLISELQAKVGVKRGKKRSLNSMPKSESYYQNMLPLNELTWPEVTRRYLLSMLCIDDNTNALHSGKVFRCLVGDGGELCGSLIGVIGMKSDALLLAQAMHRIFGSLDREYKVLTVDDGEASQHSACMSSSSPRDMNIPEWANLLQPVRKLPTTVGSQIRNCVRAALEKYPPEWAKKLLEYSISKEVYKGNASGPTKKVVVSVLATVKKREKPNEKSKGRKYASISDIIMRQCRRTLRKVANFDDKKLLCNLLGQRLANFCEGDDEGILGFPSYFSCPLDFRTIDLRLAVGAYDGSHEAFYEDVQEFWNHVRISYREKPHLLQLAHKLSSNFDELYEAEVLAIYQKLVGYSRLGCLTAEAKKEVDEFIVSSSVLPKAPWESGVCKICAIDKNDGLVLLCDTCDAKYHTYCLNPPLLEVHPGNWHCVSCVFKTNANKDTSEENSTSYYSRREGLGELTVLRVNQIKQQVSFLGDNDYWDHNLKERIVLLKFLFDEWLNSDSNRDAQIESIERTERASSGRSYPDSESLLTKAAVKVEYIFGHCFELETIVSNKQGKKAQTGKIISDIKLFRCNCFQLVKPFYPHCLSCHKTFVTKRESDRHNDDQCELGLGSSSVNHENCGIISPYNFENIRSKFVIIDSMKDLVKEIGLLGSNGIPVFLPSELPYPNDPGLQLNSSGNESCVSNKSIGIHGPDKSEYTSADRKNQNSSIDNCCVFPKSSLKPLLGKSYYVLNLLKMNLMDMEAALPKAAIRPSKACIKRMWAWRSFVKQARTIAEMVQAVIAFEDMIKPNNKNNRWWYWSSLSAAAEISTLSALALRIYSLDASIVY